MVVLCFWFDLVGYSMLVAVALFGWVVDCLLCGLFGFLLLGCLACRFA